MWCNTLPLSFFLDFRVDECQNIPSDTSITSAFLFSLRINVWINSISAIEEKIHSVRNHIYKKKMEYLIGEWKGWTKRWIAAIYDRIDYELIAQALRSSFSVNAIYVWISTRRLGQRCALCTMHVHPHTHTFYIQWIGLSNGRKKWIWKFQEYYFHFPFHFSAASACRTVVSIIIRRPFSAEKQFLPIFRTFFFCFFSFRVWF